MLPVPIKYNHTKQFTNKRDNYKQYTNAPWNWHDVLDETHILKQINVHYIHMISIKYNIKERTLRKKYKLWIDNCQYIDDTEQRGGHNKLFSVTEEKDLYDYILNVFINNNLFFDDGCLKIISKKKWHLLHGNDNNLFKASNGWINDFKNKWKLSTRTPSYSRIAKNTNENDIKIFFNNCKTGSATTKKEFIFNIDETFWRIINESLSVIGIIGTENRKLLTNSNLKLGHTIIFMISADGKVHIPIIIIKGKTDRCLKKLESINNNSIHKKFTTNGWTNENIIIFILENIYNITKGEKSILILDQYSSHKTDGIYEIAKKLNITLIYVPVGTTGQHQPLDVGVNGPVKSIGKMIQKEIYLADPFAEPNLIDSINSVIESVNKIKEDTIIKSFKKSCNI